MRWEMRMRRRQKGGKVQEKEEIKEGNKAGKVNEEKRGEVGV